MPRQLTAASLALIASWIASGQTYTISAFAGGGLPASIAGTSASLYGPRGIAVDKAGNVFFADGNTVLRSDAKTGVLTLVAGNGTQGFSGDDGPATSAQLNFPFAVAVDSADNLYIADWNNNRIRRVSNGVIATVAGNGSIGYSGDNGAATSAQLAEPSGVAVDSSGNLYIADSRNNRIRRVSNGVITTVAGNGAGGYGGDGGPATAAQLNWPQGVAVDSAGNLYIADTINNRTREVSGGVIATVAGNGTLGYGGDGGPAIGAQLYGPSAIGLDPAGNLYIDGGTTIREVSNGVITTVAGNGGMGFSGDNGAATSAQLDGPQGVAADAAGNLYIADTGNYRIRKVSSGAITTAVGGGTSLGDGGPATSAQLNGPPGVAVDSAGSLYIADSRNNRIRRVSNGMITAVAGNGASGFSGDNGSATAAALQQPSGVAVDSGGNLYIADTYNFRIRKVSGGAITTVAGTGIGGYSGDGGAATSAQLAGAYGVAVDSGGNLYIADTSNNRVRKVSNGVITTVAGNGTAGFSGDNGPATSALLNQPQGVAVDTAGNLYIADLNNNRIRKVSNGTFSTIAGNGAGGYSGDNGPATSAQLYEPYGVAADGAGNLYIADTLSNRIRKVSSGVITTVAGNGAGGFGGDNGSAAGAELYWPQGVAVDSTGNLYIADTINNRIRLLTPGTLPAISHGGVVPVYSPVSTVQPGSWVSIYGTNLASQTTLWKGDFPMSLGGTSVTVDNKPAFLWYVSPTQINLQAPDDTAAGPVNVVVSTASGTATSTVMLAAYGPSFSLLGDGKHVAAEIPTPNGTGAYDGGLYDLVGPSNTFSYSTRPVKAGETLVLYGVGFGPTTPHLPAGQAFTGAAPTTSPVTVTIGGVPAVAAWAGITEAGLYQINLTVPAGIASGDQALVATVGGVRTPAGPVVSVQ